MTPKTAGWISIDSVVVDYLTQSEQSNHKYNKLWNLAFRGMDKLGIGMFYQIRTQKLPVKGNKTVDIPADCIRWNKVGILNSRGEIVVLKQNDKLTNFAANLPDRQTKTEDNTLVDIYNQNPYNFFNFWTGGFFYQLYGAPSGTQVGGYKVSVSDGVILLNEDFAYDYIMLEYQCAPDESQEYSIPLVFREALIAWLAWKDNELSFKGRKLGVPVSELKSNFYNERRHAIAQWNPLDLNQAYQWNLENQRLTVKI
jgi:hypothetical protein